jgi:hypothetical protein
MEIERIDDQDLLSRLGQSSGPRTQGVLHLSDITKSIMKNLQPERFDKRDRQGRPISMNMQQVEVGFLFEDMLERRMAEKFGSCRVGEIVSDEGIYMSPDPVNPMLGCGEEYKFTWMSSRKGGGTTPYTDEYGMPNDKYRHWFFQMKGYAKWLQTDTFMLRVAHANGDYERPFRPQFLTHKIRFTEQELEENWQMHVNHARDTGMLV